MTTALAATDVMAPGLYNRLRKCEGDEDWYTFTGTENQAVEVYTNHVSDADLDIRVWGDAAGTDLIAEGTSSEEEDESVSFDLPDDPNTMAVDTQTEQTVWVQITTKVPGRLEYDLLLYRDLDGDGIFGPGEGPEDRECPDRFEDNDSRGDAVELASGTYGDLRMCWGGGRSDEDYYEIFVPNDAELTARALFDHDEGDLRLDVYRDGVGSPIDSSNTSDDNEEIVTLNDTGQSRNYQVRVRGSSGTLDSDYDLELELNFLTNCAEDAVSGDDLAGAPATAAGNYPDLALCEGNEDWFKLENLGVGDDVEAYIEFNNRFGNVDLELLDDTGAVVATSASDENIESIDYAIDAANAGTYYLRVFPRDGVFIRNAYDLWVAVGTNQPAEPYCPDDYERNDDRVGAAPLNVTSQQLYQDMIACGADRDWYELSSLSSGTYQIAVFFEEVAGLDLDAQIVDASGAQLDAATGAGDDAFLEFGATSGQTYYLGIENVATNAIESPYTLYVNRASAPCDEDNLEPNNNSFAAKPLMTIPGSYQFASCGGQVSASAVDYFTFNAVNGGTVTITAIHNPADVDLGMEVREGNSIFNGTKDGGRITATVNGVAPGDAITVGLLPIAGEGLYFLEIEN